MKAAFITAYGALDRVQIGPQPKPSPTAGEVLVWMRDAHVNPIDRKLVP